ncbi:FtsX-like permease family protein [Virgibacillus doumboii]|uniref:FtsX-like permease family protein n=1 Tax=Virgibacillus doumboii TaxID=2697503 RepID=UPI0013E0E038|nr:FtsX-like permease family protein [Virgibacillus doumboii]
MIRFIWRSWWRNKERFILLLIGALIVSAGLSYLVGVSEANKATVVDSLEKRWSASYDIVVRPEGSRSVTEDKDLLEPNYLSGLSGGISMEQYEKIKAMENVDIAAPISMIGYVNTFTVMEDNLNITKNGIYRLSQTSETDTGVQNISDDYPDRYFTVGPWDSKNQQKGYGIIYFDQQQLSIGSNILLAGIDPEAESRLVGLDESVIKTEKSRFFTEDDKSTARKELSWKETTLPVLASNQVFVDETTTFTIERLDLPFSDHEVVKKTMEKVKENGGKKYLEQIETTDRKTYSFSSQEAYDKFKRNIKDGFATEDIIMGFEPTPTTYQPVSSPFPERWPYAYQVESFQVPESTNLPQSESYRPVKMTNQDFSKMPRLNVNYIGVFDPGKLDVSKDPLNELPMETYFPSKAQQVLDAENKPVNPPAEMKPVNSPYGFLTKPPSMLTTIEAAAEIMGDKPISAIRIKAKNVDSLSEESQQRLETLAKEIEDKTGLITDITLGSSPQPALAYVPETDSRESSGWLQQPWVKLGSSFAIFKETKVGFSGVVGSVVLVAIVYVFTSNLISMYARRKEFAVLLSTGWRPQKLAKLIYTEALLLGIFVSLVSWFILGFIMITQDTDTSVLRILLIGVLGLLIYLLGAIIPAFLTRKITPYETIQSGEVSKGKRYFRTKSLVSMAFNQLLAKWKRSVLSIAAIAVPTSLLTVFLFVTFRLQGVMYTTWLGQYVALEVGPMHYAAMAVALLIAILTTAEIIWQNVSERQSELALLKAVGWKHGTIRSTILLEGLISGFIAGIFGLLIALVIIWQMYQTFPVDQIGFLLLTWFVPIVTGLIGAFAPAQKAVNIQPYQGMQGAATNSKRTEKRFKFAIGSLAAVLFAGFLTLMAMAVPEMQDNLEANQTQENAPDPTEGEVAPVTADDDDEEKEEEDKSESDKSDGAANEENQIKVRKTYQQGENISYIDHVSIKIGEIIETPEEHKQDSIEDDMKYLTIPVTFIAEKKFTELTPTVYKLSSVTNRKKGEFGTATLTTHRAKIDPIDYTTLENDGWRSGLMHKPGKVVFAVTYIVPKDKTNWSVIFQQLNFTGERYFEVKLTK